MDENLDGLYQQWEFARSCTKSFIDNLSDDQLDRALPRKGLNTIRKHFQEMILVQKDYIEAIDNLEMDFNSIPDNEIDGKATKEDLLEQMAQQDKLLKEILSKVSDRATINWFGAEKPLAFHISALISHESLHIGQIVAFSYVLELPIPDYITKNWGLSGR